MPLASLVPQACHIRAGTSGEAGVRVVSFGVGKLQEHSPSCAYVRDPLKRAVGNVSEGLVGSCRGNMQREVRGPADPRDEDRLALRRGMG